MWGLGLAIRWIAKPIRLGLSHERIQSMTTPELTFLENPPALAVGSDGSEPPDGPGSLLYILEHKYRIPKPDAILIVDEVVLSFFKCSSRIENVRAWLVAAACNGARHYHRQRTTSAC